MSINYQDRIPNNVDLGSNRILQRALEHWQPEFLNWWQELGPKDFQVADVYLRTATSVDAKGWATYGFVRMPEYRWGIFLEPAKVNPKGDVLTEKAWVVNGELIEDEVDKFIASKLAPATAGVIEPCKNCQ